MGYLALIFKIHWSASNSGGISMGVMHLGLSGSDNGCCFVFDSAAIGIEVR